MPTTLRVSAVACIACALNGSIYARQLLHAATNDTYAAHGYSRGEIYRSRQSPSYRCWVGAWAMPDSSLMVSFTQATGPLDGRPRMPAWVEEKWGWPIGGNFAYDFTGLDLNNVYSVQMTPVGRGAHDPYGKEQHIVMDTFRIAPRGE